jgi:digeranylgeranylglycerophospholipid reductase
METDLIVVGAGPAGSMAALAAARGGLRVALVDKKRAVGEPVQCAEGVSRFALESNGLPPDPAYIRQEVRGAQGVVPNGKRFDITRLPGYAVDRARFDASIADRAVDAGAALSLGHRITSLSRSGGRWEVRGNGSTWTAPAVIGADGPATLVARWAGLLLRADCVRAYEWRFAASDVPAPEPDRFLLYFDPRYDGGYAWIFPRGGEVNVGAGGHIDAHAALQGFCRERGIDPSRRLQTIAGQIPYHFDLRRYSEDGVAIVGDAAGVTNPLNGGGIHAALWSGRVAGELAAEGRLDAYDGVLRASPFLDPVLYWMIERLRRWDDRVLNFVADLLEGTDWREVSALSGLRRAARDPRMFAHLREFLRMRRAVALTEIYGW